MTRWPDKAEMTDPDMGTWSYGYDTASRLVSQTDGRGVTLSFVYDDLGRITQRKQGSTILADYTYGANNATANRAGRLTKTRINNSNDAAVVDIASYDPDGMILSQDIRISAVTYEADYTYHDGGAIKTIQYPSNGTSRETVTYGYDGLGQPFDLVGAQTYVDDASWTAQGLPNLWTVGPSSGGTTRRWDYDPQTLRTTMYKAGTTQLGGGVNVNLMRLEYSYDDSGNVTSILDYKNSSQRQCFTYNSRNRLITAFTGNSGCTAYSSVGLNPFNHTYSYSAIHNLTGIAGVTQGFGSGNDPGSGDAGPHAMVSAGSTTFGYDDNGNRVSKTAGGQATAYTYDSDSRLVTVDLPSDPNDVVYVYDADGARVRRAKGNYSTTYIAGLMEIDRNGTTVTQTRTSYMFAGTQVATRTHVNPQTILVFDDHLGSSHTAFNDTTDAVIRLRYFPWGKDRGSSGVWPSDRRFTGQISDDTAASSGDIDLLFYNARYYDPATGSFVAADTIVADPSHPTDLNRYAYVRNNPINFTDPSGHVPMPPLIEGGTALDWDAGLWQPFPRGQGDVRQLMLEAEVVDQYVFRSLAVDREIRLASRLVRGCPCQMGDRGMTLSLSEVLESDPAMARRLAVALLGFDVVPTALFSWFALSGPARSIIGPVLAIALVGEILFFAKVYRSLPKSARNSDEWNSWHFRIGPDRTTRLALKHASFREGLVHLRWLLLAAMLAAGFSWITHS